LLKNYLKKSMTGRASNDKMGEFSYKLMVELKGFEPLIPCMQSGGVLALFFRGWGRGHL